MIRVESQCMLNLLVRSRHFTAPGMSLSAFLRAFSISQIATSPYFEACSRISTWVNSSSSSKSRHLGVEMSMPGEGENSLLVNDMLNLV